MAHEIVTNAQAWAATQSDWDESLPPRFVEAIPWGADVGRPDVLLMLRTPGGSLLATECVPHLELANLNERLQQRRLSAALMEMNSKAILPTIEETLDAWDALSAGLDKAFLRQTLNAS